MTAKIILGATFACAVLAVGITVAVLGWTDCRAAGRPAVVCVLVTAR